MRLRREIKCPQCGAEVTIPFFWVVGIEGIFRCGQCKKPFKTGYKMGAVLSALALSISVAMIQLMAYILSIYAMPLLIMISIPMWLSLSFIFRKKYMLSKIRRAYLKNHNDIEIY